MIFKYLLPFIFNLLYLIVRLYNLIFNDLHVYLAYKVPENLRVLSQELVESVPAHRCPKSLGSDLNVSQFTWLLQAAQGCGLVRPSGTFPPHHLGVGPASSQVLLQVCKMAAMASDARQQEGGRRRGGWRCVFQGRGTVVFNCCSNKLPKTSHRRNSG